MILERTLASGSGNGNGVKTTWRLLLLKRTLASGSMEMCEDYLEAASLEEDTPASV